MMVRLQEVLTLVCGHSIITTPRFSAQARILHDFDTEDHKSWSEQIKIGFRAFHISYEGHSLAPVEF
jgi:hypothetical protein